MGGASVPSSTSQYQKLATGIWGSDQATALAKPILKPALASIKNQQDMLMGLQKGDPAQARKFFGLPETASGADVAEQMLSHMRGPKIAMPSTPQEEQRAQQPKNYTRMAAAGGIMSLDDDGPKDPRKFATGGDSAPKDITKQQADTIARWQKQGNITPAKQRQIDQWTQQRQIYQNYQRDKSGISDAARQAGLTPANAYIGQAGYFGGAYNPTTNTFSVTNPYYNEAINILQGMNRQPEQFGQATDAYNRAISGLSGMTNYTPERVIAQEIQAERIAAELAKAYGYDPDVVRGGTGYGVMQMNAPRDIRATGYTAEEAQAAQMEQPLDVLGQYYDAARIEPTAREAAQQIGDIGTITGQGYTAAQMGPTRKERASTTAAPKSWTSRGTAAQYMSPYMQNVVDIQKRESMRDYGKQLAALNAQAAKSKAYGGSRQAIERSEAARGQAQRLSDIEAQGLQQAYQSGMGQFQAEQGLGSQVGMSNTAQINQLKSQYMQMGMTEAQANQAAINQAQQFTASQGQAAQAQNVSNQLARQQANAQMVNQLKSQYMQMGLTEAQANQAALNQASQFGAQSEMQAQLANQQAGLATGQANLNAEQQAILANQNAINQQRSQYVTQALQAATTSYGGQLTAAQQNQLAANAAAQFNAQNQQQINMVDQAAVNAGLQFYAAAQNTAAAQYAQNQLAASQSNQQSALQASLANQQSALQAAMANQSAGLQANQQNLSAYGLIGNMAQGLGSIGSQVGNYGSNLANMWGQAGGVLQGIGQNYFNQQQQNAANIWGGPATLAGQGVGILGGMGGGQSGVTAQASQNR